MKLKEALVRAEVMGYNYVAVDAASDGSNNMDIFAYKFTPVYDAWSGQWVLRDCNFTGNVAEFIGKYTGSKLPAATLRGVNNGS